MGQDQQLKLEIQGSKEALLLSLALWGQGKSYRLLLARRPSRFQEIAPDSSLLRERNSESPWGYFQFGLGCPLATGLQIDFANGRRYFFDIKNKYPRPTPSLCQNR
ncbi:MAG: hypothetical protein N2318_03620 [Meiothermus sp.]|nr:hypothetical protein [Meiothermus sp.]